MAYGLAQTVYPSGYIINGSYGEPLSITYDVNTVYTSGASTQPYVMMPATYSPAPVRDDSNVTWLKEQVEEIAELARAA